MNTVLTGSRNNTLQSLPADRYIWACPYSFFEKRAKRNEKEMIIGNKNAIAFDLKKTSVVAVGMIGCKHERIAFMKGYNAMLDKIDPAAVICFGTPFPEMRGNIISVDYLSSRKVVRS